MEGSWQETSQHREPLFVLLYEKFNLKMRLMRKGHEKLSSFSCKKTGWLFMKIGLILQELQGLWEIMQVMGWVTKLTISVRPRVKHSGLFHGKEPFSQKTEGRQISMWHILKAGGATCPIHTGNMSITSGLLDICSSLCRCIFSWFLIVSWQEWSAEPRVQAPGNYWVLSKSQSDIHLTVCIWE